MGSISAQWALNSTVESFADIVKASTSDNVAPNALIVAESFGSTIVISETTRLKVEDVGKLHHFSSTIKFLKSRIGYAKGDCADYLASSDGGVRFLGLAAALLCTSSSLVAASTVHTMIRNGAPTGSTNDTVLPTLNQIQFLLESLEHKMCRAGFGTYVSTWQILLGKLCPFGNDELHPPMQMIEALVDSFRTIDTLENGDLIEVHAYAGIPWIVTFITWCLGGSPSITATNGHLLFSGSLSNTMVVLNTSASDLQEVRVKYKIKNASLLWSGPFCKSDNEAWSGMVPFKVYGNQRLASLGLECKDARLALCEALSSSLPVVRGNLWPMITSERGPPFHPALGHENHRGADSVTKLVRHRTQIFGTEQQVNMVLGEYVDVADIEITPSSGERQSGCFPTLESYLQEVVTECGCSVCSHIPSDYVQDNVLGLRSHKPGSLTTLSSLAASICGKAAQAFDLDSHCAAIRFWSQVSTITAEILALSLYDCTDPVHLFWCGGTAASSRIKGKLLDSVHECIFFQSSTARFCRIHDILRVSTILIGHDISDELTSGTWIASAARGQVIAPAMFHTCSLSTNPLVLGGGPGQLFFQDTKPDKIISSSPHPASYELSVEACTTAVDRVLNLFPEDHLEWQISPTQKDPELFLGTSRVRKIYNPHDVLGTATMSLYVSCSHPDDSVLPTPTQDCIYLMAPFFADKGPVSDYYSQQSMEKHVHMRKVQQAKTPFKIQILPTAGNEELRLFAMCSPFPGVVRNKACLQCCINVCRKSGLEYIVL